MDKNTVLNFLKKDSKKLRADLVAVFAIGVMLIILGNSFFSTGKSPSTKNAIVAETSEAEGAVDQCAKIENRMRTLFSKVDGAGEVDVMVTLKSGNEIVVAQEESFQEKIQTDGQEKSSETKAVLLESTGGTNKPLVLKEKSPEVEGVVIIAQGGDNIIVKEALIKGAQALLNVPAHKVEVFKMNKK